MSTPNEDSPNSRSGCRVAGVTVVSGMNPARQAGNARVWSLSNAHAVRQAPWRFPVRMLASMTLLVVMVLAFNGCTTQGAQDQPEAGLVDETGAVLESRFHLDPHGGGLPVRADEFDDDAGAVSLDPPLGWDIRVAWPAAPCQLAPTVTVTGNDEQITEIHVDRGPWLGPGECPAMLVMFGVDLRTSRSPAPDLVVTGSGD